jgi:hypothetical protein
MLKDEIEKKINLKKDKNNNLDQPISICQIYNSGHEIMITQ